MWGLYNCGLMLLPGDPRSHEERDIETWLGLHLCLLGIEGTYLLVTCKPTVPVCSTSTAPAATTAVAATETRRQQRQQRQQQPQPQPQPQPQQQHWAAAAASSAVTGTAAVVAGSRQHQHHLYATAVLKRSLRPLKTGSEHNAELC